MTVDTSEMMEFVRNDGTSSEMTVDTSEMMVHSSEMMELVRNDESRGIVTSLRRTCSPAKISARIVRLARANAVLGGGLSRSASLPVAENTKSLWFIVLSVS